LLDFFQVFFLCVVVVVVAAAVVVVVSLFLCLIGKKKFLIELHRIKGPLLFVE